MNKDDFDKLEGEKYYGVADCYGIESFKKYDGANPNSGDMFGMQIRATSNAQRHAVFYLACLTPELAQTIKKKIESKDWEGALLHLKMADDVFMGAGNAKMWENIPNPKLDPYG